MFFEAFGLTLAVWCSSFSILATVSQNLIWWWFGIDEQKLSISPAFKAQSQQTSSSLNCSMGSPIPLLQFLDDLWELDECSLLGPVTSGQSFTAWLSASRPSSPGCSGSPPWSGPLGPKELRSSSRTAPVPARPSMSLKWKPGHGLGLGGQGLRCTLGLCNWKLLRPLDRFGLFTGGWWSESSSGAPSWCCSSNGLRTIGSSLDDTATFPRTACRCGSSRSSLSRSWALRASSARRIPALGPEGWPEHVRGAGRNWPWGSACSIAGPVVFVSWGETLCTFGSAVTASPMDKRIPTDGSDLGVFGWQCWFVTWF